MAIGRDDRWLTDAQGRALAGAQVYWCTQPAIAPSSPPPEPLATIYTDITGVTPETQPILTDGFGHAWTYLNTSAFYTVVMYHPLFGANPIVIPDQNLAGGTASIMPFSGTLTGTLDGTNRIFTISVSSSPQAMIVWDNFPLVLNVGFTAAYAGGVLTITFATAPQPTDTLYVQGLL